MNYWLGKPWLGEPWQTLANLGKCDILGKSLFDIGLTLSEITTGLASILKLGFGCMGQSKCLTRVQGQVWLYGDNLMCFVVKITIYRYDKCNCACPMSCCPVKLSPSDRASSGSSSIKSRTTRCIWRTIVHLSSKKLGLLKVRLLVLTARVSKPQHFGRLAFSLAHFGAR